MRKSLADRKDRSFSLTNRERKVWSKVAFAQCPHCEEYTVYKMREPQKCNLDGVMSKTETFEKYCFTCSFKW